ncbi:MAG: hypothetical protein ACTS1X_06965 [Parasphingopyxis sp.]|uniref:hypothetical protein n=1 Tax=Parasphingopyxis sp. TaxID=1920299 RepID=UPI003F9FFFF0
MAEEYIPVQYHAEFYINSTLSDPIASFSASTPFGAMSVGDYVDGRSFADAGHVARQLRITGLEHIFWEIENSHFGHKLMVVLEELDAAQAD